MKVRNNFPNPVQTYLSIRDPGTQSKCKRGCNGMDIKMPLMYCKYFSTTAAYCSAWTARVTEHRFIGLSWLLRNIEVHSAFWVPISKFHGVDT